PHLIRVIFVWFQDRHVKHSPGSATDREPEVDPSQDYQLLLGYENSTHTVLRFRRKLDTCDHHDIPITNDTMRLVWAFHQDEPVGGAVGPKSLPRHDTTSRGAQSLYLVQRADQEAPSPEETVKIWELRNPAVEVPLIPGESLHWCRVFRIPQSINRKHHLIRYEPLQGKTGANGLQHLVLYECQDNPLVEKLADSPGRQCHDLHSQPFIICNTVVASWARGSEGFSFPPEAGYPLDSSSRYYLLETHYTSTPDATMGAIDGSGLRLFYTPQLRRHDAGVISMGMDPNWRHIIPPGQNKVVSSGHCIPDCTRQAFPHSGINMFAVVMKTHKIGRQVALRHIRGSNELPPIATDDNVDSDYQEYRKLGVPVRILPGDHLITECTYNSSGRSAITLGGLTSREETCLVLGLYYPRQKSLAACHSLPSLPTVLHSLGIQELSPGSNPVRIAAPPELAGMTLESRLVSYDWDNQFNSFQEATMRGSFKPICWTSQLSLLPGTDKESHYPNISKPYVRSTVDHCNYKRYSTEGWPGGTPLLELDSNHIEGATKSKVSRSSSPAAEESMGLTISEASAPTSWSKRFLLVMSVILIWCNR
ncbi:MOXD1 homolog 2-like, partial [Cylas formicarius]|uniref:MOXD1 homolog 2-like n=1 Tax=Cylas formicarius TaxID=197179 RepID=UPI00295889D1